jgi:hypothetical protein
VPDPRRRSASGSSTDDDPDHPERLLEGHVDAAGDRDLASEQPFRSACVVVEHVADVACLPAGVADGVPGVADLQRRQLLDVVVHHGRETAQQAGPGRPGSTARQEGPAACARSIAASVSARPTSSIVVKDEPVAGSSTA